jgi:hypothetical protein
LFSFVSFPFPLFPLWFCGIFCILSSYCNNIWYKYPIGVKPQQGPHGF